MKPAELLIQKLLSYIYKRERDPERPLRIWHEYDTERGYQPYAEYCQSLCERRPEPPANSELAEQGFTCLKMLDPEEAGALIETLYGEYQPARIKKDAPYMKGFHITDRVFIRNILDKILNETVDKKLLEYFNSEYLVHTITVTSTEPQDRQTVSFSWHCDKGPRKHLKLLLFLNATADHGGNTEFINLSDTAKVADKGYLFGLSSARTDSIEHLSSIAGSPLQSHSREMQAGGGVIFQPATVLHRGIAPGSGPRIVITLCLLPSPMHWSEAFKLNTLFDLAVDEKWHLHASELLDKFQRREEVVNHD